MPYNNAMEADFEEEYEQPQRISCIRDQDEEEDENQMEVENQEEVSEEEEVSEGDNHVQRQKKRNAPAPSKKSKKTKNEQKEDEPEDPRCDEKIILDNFVPLDKLYFLLHTGNRDPNKDISLNIQDKYIQDIYSRKQGAPTGRFYYEPKPNNPFHPQLLDRKSRSYLYENIGLDVDAVACVQTILNGLFNNYNDHPRLKTYTSSPQEREKILEKISEDDNCDRDGAKEIVTACTNGRKYIGNNEFMKEYQKEMKKIMNKCIAFCKKNNIDFPDDKPHTAVAKVYFYHESLMLKSMINFFGTFYDENAIMRTTVMVPMHDGCIINIKNKEYKDEETAKKKLPKLSDHVYKETGLRMTFKIKPMVADFHVRQYLLTQPTITIKKNPSITSMIFHAYITLYFGYADIPGIFRIKESDTCAIYDKKAGHWQICNGTQKNPQFDAVLDEFITTNSMFLNFGNTSSIDQLKTTIKQMMPVQDDLFYKHRHTRQGKLFFRDGYWDAKTDTYQETLNQPFFNPHAIDLSIHEVRDSSIRQVKWVKQEIFGKPFSDPAYADFNTKTIAKALCGHPEKNCTVNSGNTNSGKSTIQNLLLNTFGTTYVGTVNGNHFSKKDSRFANAEREGEFLYPARNNLIVFVNEMANDVINNEFFKKVVDICPKVQCRLQYAKSTITFPIYGRFHFFTNTTLKFAREEAAIQDRVFPIDMDRRAVDDPKSEYEFKKDPTIHEKISQLEIKKATIRVMQESYLDYLKNGDQIPEGILETQKERCDDRPVESHLHKYNARFWTDKEKERFEEVFANKNPFKEEVKERDYFIETWGHSSQDLPDEFQELKLSSVEIIRQLKSIPGLIIRRTPINGRKLTCCFGFTFNKLPQTTPTINQTNNRTDPQDIFDI